MTVDWMGNGVLAFLAAVGIAALVWLVGGIVLPLYRLWALALTALLSAAAASVTADSFANERRVMVRLPIIPPSLVLELLYFPETEPRRPHAA